MAGEDPRTPLWYQAGLASLEYIPPDAEIVAFGTGRTVQQTLRALCDSRLYQGRQIVCATDGIESFARSLGVLRIADRSALADVDYVYIDGADQIDPLGNLIKGGYKGLGNPGLGGSMYKEKRLAYGAGTFIVVGDSSKVVTYLGEGGYWLPVEFTPGEEQRVIEFLRSVIVSDDIHLRHRPEGEIFVTENQRYIYDVQFDGRRHDLSQLERLLDGEECVFSNGIFSVRKPDHILVAYEEGVRRLDVKAEI